MATEPRILILGPLACGHCGVPLSVVLKDPGRTESDLLARCLAVCGKCDKLSRYVLRNGELALEAAPEIRDGYPKPQ